MVNLKERENYIVIILLIYKSSQTSVLSISPITSILFLLYLAYIFLKRNIKIGNFFVYFTIFSTFGDVTNRFLSPRASKCNR